MRTGRTNGATAYSYIYNGSQLVQMTVGSNTLQFFYDAFGTPMGLTYNGTAYYYVTNAQGDVIAIVDSIGQPVVQYTYDAWGNLLSTTGTLTATLGAHNPLRYRGYVYDTETQLYYLQSRYYDPTTCRFINADSYASTGQGMVGHNMFAYCLNNPVMRIDPTGTISCGCKYDGSLQDFRRLEQGLPPHSCPHNKELEEFNNLYKRNTGKDYNFYYPGAVTVTKSTTVVYKYQPVLDGIAATVIGLILDASGTYVGMPFAGRAFLQLVVGVAYSASSLTPGSYPTYTVTKTKYVTHQVETADYRGYKVYANKAFRYREVESFVFLHGEIVSQSYTVYDDYYAYTLYNQYKNHG